MRVLTFTSLYPNKIDPQLGIFVKTRMDYFDQIEGTSRKVIAPVHYAPLLGLHPSSKFHSFNQIPREERQGNIPVYHPRYMTIPGTNLINVVDAMARAAEKTIDKIYPKGETFDLIDGHYLYPDGIAAFKMATKHNKPLILTARGSDVNFWMEQKHHKASIMEALNYAAKVICVSQALKQRLIQHGIAEDKLVVLMNGVDKSIFKADISDDNRGRYLLTVGNLVPLKGHEYILRALVAFPEETLLIIGTGECEKSLKRLAQQLNISDRVSFLTHIPHLELPPYYRGAKATILMSSMEGMPNVVLESLASGTPVIATNVGGIPEVLTKDNGILLPDRTWEALRDALKQALDRDWNNHQISKDMNYLNWPETARKLHDCFLAALQDT